MRRSAQARRAVTGTTGWAARYRFGLGRRWPARHSGQVSQGPPMPQRLQGTCSSKPPDSRCAVIPLGRKDETFLRFGALVAEDQRETALECRGQLLAHRPLLEALDQRREEPFDHQTLGFLLADPVRAKVEQLLGVDLGDRRSMSAADVVGLDLESGDGVGVGAL